MAKTPVVTEIVRETDILPRDMEKMLQWKEEGLEGIASLTESDFARAAELYLSGKSYREISQITNKPKVFFVYLSDRYSWFKMKMDYLDELDQTMKDRLNESKLHSDNFLLKLSHALQKKMSKSVDKYLATDDSMYLDRVDEKQLAKWMKIYEMLYKSDAPRAPSAGVNVNLNMGNGVTISKASDGSVELNTKEKTVAEKLKEMADARRAEAKAALQISTDIKNQSGDPNESK